MRPPAKRQLYIASSLADAFEARVRFGATAEFLAGGTWIMRADHREEFGDRHYISIGHLEEMATIDITEGEIAIGAGATHAQLAAATAHMPDLAALHEAAGRSANPAIRAMATVGGNICTPGFAAADLVPALLCLSASVEIATADARRRMPLEDFLAVRESSRTDVLTRVFVARRPHRSAHARLPLKKAGDYPVAIVSVSLARGASGRIDAATIAVGSVEPVARRWRTLETAIQGTAMKPEDITAIAAKCNTEFRGRNGIEAPGWYRIKVLPELVRRAFQDLLA
jgi:carbon-monoxide dehydrogenase medium subunit